MAQIGDPGSLHAPSEESAEEGKRYRTLTPKAMDLYEQKVRKLTIELTRLSGQIDIQLTTVKTCREETETVISVKKGIETLLHSYRSASDIFTEYLTRTRTKQSLRENSSHELIRVTLESKVQSTFQYIDSLSQQQIPSKQTTSVNIGTRSAKSVNSQRRSSTKGQSVRSITSSEISRKRVKTEAAKTHLQFERREAELKKERARLDEEDVKARAAADRRRSELQTDMDLLAQEKDAGIAETELKIAQEELGYSSESNSERSRRRVEATRSGERTSQYVLNQNDLKFPDRALSMPEPTNNIDHTAEAYAPLTRDIFNVAPAENTRQSIPPIPLNTNAPPFIPFSAQCSDFSKFLIKKEMVMSRLSIFDDTPRNYISWKASFKAIMKEVDASPPEELDLLIKWLGTKSSRHAKSIRASIAGNPEEGRQQVWNRLDEQYGNPEAIQSALKMKVDMFPKLSEHDAEKLYDLLDILSEIQTVKANKRFSGVLSYYDSSLGINQILSKVPPRLQNKWIDRAGGYKRSHDYTYPPFSFFVAFMREMTTMMNDSSLIAPYAEFTQNNAVRHRTEGYRRPDIRVKKTEVDAEPQHRLQPFDKNRCHIHNTNHSLNQCKKFRYGSIAERKRFLFERHICYRCCNSSSHIYKNCEETIHCDVCGSDRHPSALHAFSPAQRNGGEKEQKVFSGIPSHGGEKKNEGRSTVSNQCTRICGKGFIGRSCAKTLLVRLHPVGEPHRAQTVYAILDDQSNRTLGRSEIFNFWNIPDGRSEPYTIVSCAGRLPQEGRRLRGLAVTSMDGSHTMALPTIIECDQIPNNQEEIPPPQVRHSYPHMKYVRLPQIRDDVDVLLLLGRDLPEAFHVQDQRTGARGEPFAQRLKLGWVVVGEVCLGRMHEPDIVDVSVTHILMDGRPTLFEECQNKITVKDLPDLGKDIFQRTKNDDKPGLSKEDKAFIEIMNREFTRNAKGTWTAPLPFRHSRPRLPNNRAPAFKRAQILDAGLQRDPVKKKHFVTFMKGVIENGHAEVAPPLEDDEECWYLPLFGVYHAKKPNQIRGVFDSSAKYAGVSLNEVLLKGPDVTNSLIGVLLRFRKEAVAVSGDIEQMFYCFSVREDHRNFLRFLWYRNNDPTEDLIEYRMCKHVFGNSPSPAVATYGLRRTACEAEDEYGSDMRDFVEKGFYVDDGLTSLPSPEEAISLMSRTQEALLTGGIRLHKISSNCQQVIGAFPTEDLARDLKDMNLVADKLPIQQSLGLCWDLQRDAFTFKVSEHDKPYTRRGILSTINRLYDPLGFLAPVTIQGKILLQTIITGTIDWDEPLSDEFRELWENWERSLHSLNNILIPRSYAPSSVCGTLQKELHIYSDASEKAISAVAYLKTIDEQQNMHVGFGLGKSKVAPKHGHTIPRLELCAAVLAVEIAEILTDQLSLPPDCVTFYSDSKVVLGYLTNQTRRFYIYVENRVNRILTFAKPEQWFYVQTEENPADHGTRFIPPDKLGASTWLLGPPHLVQQAQPKDGLFPLVQPSEDKELRPEVTVTKTEVSNFTPMPERLKKYSTWKALTKAVSYLKHIADSFRQRNKGCKGWHECHTPKIPEFLRKAETFVIKAVQRQYYGREINALQQEKTIPRDSSVLALSPALDEDGILRIGGRLRMADIPIQEKNPILLPGQHHIATLLTRHFHETVRHQGRHFTEGAIRAGGYWITGGKRLVSLVLHRCVKCRRLRGNPCFQKMADLPSDRLVPSPPFTCVGVDVFGPWDVTTRRTRGGVAANKRWAALFTCMSTRAVHIEVLEQMTSSSFINAVRRLYAIRGKVTEFRSDRGTNFIGATANLGFCADVVEDRDVQDFLYSNGAVWKFNPPHASHFGGVWERMIGVARRILDTMLMKKKHKELTHEVLSTFMAEVTAIINARPLVPVSTDVEEPFVLSPSTLLTQKTNRMVESFQHLSVKDMYRSHWKHVQVLAERFWSRWQREYLASLQPRRKWQDKVPNVKVGDVVLLKDVREQRNDWPIGILTRVFPSDDDLVRKVEVRVCQNGTTSMFIRPVTQIIELIPSASD